MCETINLTVDRRGFVEGVPREFVGNPCSPSIRSVNLLTI